MLAVSYKNYIVEASNLRQASNLIRKHNLPQASCIYFNSDEKPYDMLTNLKGLTYHVTQDSIDRIYDIYIFKNTQKISIDYDDSINCLRKILDKNRYLEMYKRLKEHVESNGYTEDLKFKYEMFIIINWYCKFFLIGIGMSDSLKLSIFIYDEKEQGRYYDVDNIVKLMSDTQLCKFDDKELFESLFEKKEKVIK